MLLLGDGVLLLRSGVLLVSGKMLLLSAALLLLGKESVDWSNIPARSGCCCACHRSQTCDSYLQGSVILLPYLLSVSRLS